MNDTHSTTAERPAIVCLAHLAWDYVWQRPQHILSRLSVDYPVYYFNEPTIEAVPEPWLKPVAAEGAVRAWQPEFPDRPEVIGPWREVYAGLVQDLLRQEGLVDDDGRAARPLILWFYTPTPYYLATRIPSDAIVYDVMDELASFKGASADLRQREDELMDHADVVFTGGRSMYEARHGRHPNLHLFPSGVDVNHFRLDDETPVAPELAALPAPVLGYYGVIDERIDLGLLDELARAHPDWTLAMVGPVAKIEKDDLPRRPNIHYLGQQPYERLPHFLRGFDVCLMPFAINEATRYISPTKTLEYMAAGKPIVSTPVPDVVATWSDVVAIAATPAAFGEAVTRALAETEAQRAERLGRAEAHLQRGSWDAIVARIRALIDEALARNRAPASKKD